MATTNNDPQEEKKQTEKLQGHIPQKQKKASKEDDKSKIDELNESLSNAGVKIAENKSKYGWITCGVLVVALAVFGFIYWHNTSNKNSAQKYSAVEQNAYNKALKDGVVNDSVFNAVSLAELEKLIKEEGSSAGGNLARIEAAERYYDMGQYQKTIDYLKEADIDDDVLKFETDILVGDCYVNLNKLGEAVKCFDKVAADANEYPMIAVRALMKKALVLDEQKNYKGALEVYQLIKKQYPNEVEDAAKASQMAGNSRTAFSIDAYIAREEARLGGK